MRRAPGFTIFRHIITSLENDGLLRDYTITKTHAVFEAYDGYSHNTLTIHRVPGRENFQIEGDHDHLRAWLAGLVRAAYREHSFWGWLGKDSLTPVPLSPTQPWPCAHAGRGGPPRGD